MVLQDSWLGKMRRTYFGNATATRDLRVQLRGSKAIILFGLYLSIMAIILMMTYESAMGSQQNSLATAQGSLESFYYATLVCLGIVISLVAPAMGAFAIVQERQRRSLDLVFSAPVEPKAYLVGKLISSYRYVWLLLILSLPFCAVSVTLGGATWAQLFITFLLFSFYGLVCASIGLLLSATCQKPLQSLVWTYLAVGTYFFCAVVIHGASVSRGFTGSLMPNNSPLAGLSPVTFPMQFGISMPVLGVNIPVWIVSIVMHLLVVKIIILGAGSYLASSDAKEIPSLRIHLLIYCVVGSWIFGQLVFDVVLRSPSFLTLDHWIYAVGRVVFGLLFTIGLFVVPHLSTFSTNDLRRHLPNGNFNLRETFSGKVSGNLPYLLLVFITLTSAFFLSSNSNLSKGVSVTTTTKAGTLILNVVSVPLLEIAPYLFLALSIWFLTYAVGVFSVKRGSPLTRGRTAALFTVLLLTMLPTAFLSILSPENSEEVNGLWLLNPISTVLPNNPPINGWLIYVHTIAIGLFATFFFVKARKRMQTMYKELPV
jgi:ABC-type transport system involved in multi-copper enzyme maturation permease subunit